MLKQLGLQTVISWRKTAWFDLLTFLYRTIHYVGDFLENSRSHSAVSTVLARQMAAHSSLKYVRNWLTVQTTSNDRVFVPGGVNPTYINESLFKVKLLWMWQLSGSGYKDSGCWQEDQYFMTNRGVVGRFKFLPRGQQWTPTAILEKTEVIVLDFVELDSQIK
jgi:hypothetical protein